MEQSKIVEWNADAARGAAAHNPQQTISNRSQSKDSLIPLHFINFIFFFWLLKCVAAEKKQKESILTVPRFGK